MNPIIESPTADSAATSKLKSTLLVFLLQAGHRLGAIALLATLGTWAMMYFIKDFHVPLAIAASDFFTPSPLSPQTSLHG